MRNSQIQKTLLNSHYLSNCCISKRSSPSAMTEYASSTMENPTHENSCFYSHRQAVKSLNILVVGAGIAGISAGLALSQHNHSVTILETSSELCEVGAGIQLAPNATRILGRLGVLDEIMTHTSILTGVSIR